MWKQVGTLFIPDFVSSITGLPSFLSTLPEESLLYTRLSCCATCCDASVITWNKLQGVPVPSNSFLLVSMALLNSLNNHDPSWLLRFPLCPCHAGNKTRVLFGISSSGDETVSSSSSSEEEYPSVPASHS